MDSIHLLGTEDVRRAGNQISEAAQSMRQTQGYQAEAMLRQQTHMDNWLERLEVALQHHARQIREIQRRSE